jgi:hypothetical protein
MIAKLEVFLTVIGWIIIGFAVFVLVLFIINYKNF